VVGGALITARHNSAGMGTKSCGLLAGGYDSGGSALACTEEYNAGAAVIVDCYLS